MTDDQLRTLAAIFAGPLHVDLEMDEEYLQQALARHLALVAKIAALLKEWETQG